MPDNFKKPSYNRKQQLYVERSKKSTPQPQKQKSQNKSKSKINNSDNIAIKHNKDIKIPVRTPKKKTPKSKFATFTIFAAFLIILSSSITYASYKYFVGDLSVDSDPNLSSITNQDTEDDFTDIVGANQSDENINVLLIGLDKGSLHTDTMIVANLNTTDGSVELISIPRDTYTVLPQYVVEEVRSSQSNPIMPTSGEMKLTELITYTQDFDLGLELLTDYVESLLNTEIDNYVAVNLESFSYLIDEIGGVYFDVPRRMYYNDNYQNLHIDLQAGYQLLDGDKAEQLIRFRKGDNSMGSYDYPQGDLGRIQVQQDFLKALINQVLSKENIVGNLVGLAKTYYNHVTTDISLLNIPNYAQYALKVDINSITTYSLPVEDGRMNSKWYALPLDEEIKVLSDKVFYDIEPELEELEEETTQPFDATLNKDDYTVTILNGSGISGFAGRTSTLLKEEGFNILDIGDYTSTKQENTRLFVNNKDNGEILESYFDEPEIVYTPNQVEDIIVVLGTKETLKGKEN